MGDNPDNSTACQLIMGRKEMGAQWQGVERKDFSFKLHGQGSLPETVTEQSLDKGEGTSHEDMVGENSK